MARPGLSYEEVVNAINQIIAQNGKPSMNTIREMIGRGSPTTISNFFKQWEETQASGEALTAKPQIELNIDETPTKAIPKLIPGSNTDIQGKINRDSSAMAETKDPIIQALLSRSEALSYDILNNMSEEWSIILNERNVEIKVKKLYSALVKEQTRRETAEKIAKEAKIYADVIKEQTAQRIADLRDHLESQVAFLNGQIRQLKRAAEADLEHYRNQLEKSNLALAACKNK